MDLNQEGTKRLHRLKGAEVLSTICGAGKCTKAILQCNMYNIIGVKKEHKNIHLIIILASSVISTLNCGARLQLKGPLIQAKKRIDRSTARTRYRVGPGGPAAANKETV